VRSSSAAQSTVSAVICAVNVTTVIVFVLVIAVEAIT
jgi:hypothetical protein